MLREELEIATQMTPTRRLWFSAQENASGRQPKQTVKTSDKALRLSLLCARQGFRPVPPVRDTAFGLLPVASATLGFIKDIGL